MSVPLEVLPTVKHDKRGILSMARHDDPGSGKSSFSILLGPAPHLDMQYTVFGHVPCPSTCICMRLLSLSMMHALTLPLCNACV